MKFPSQNKIMYAGANVSNGSFAQTHLINVAKDLSILNRRGYAMTDRKGVPWIYKVALTVYPSALDGSGYTSTDAQARTSVKALGTQNTWVARNAAVKWHAAREKMFRDAGVKKSLRGAYSHELRYCYANNGETLAAPVDGVGAAFNGGTWDTSDLSVESDADFGLVLVGNGDEQYTDDFSGTALQFSHAYLVSRVNQQLDTNREMDESPAPFSVLSKMLERTGLADESASDDVLFEARDAQDNPPYEVLDISDSGDVSHDVTEEVELGRITLQPQGSGGSLSQTVTFDVPFGIFRILMAHRDPGDDTGLTAPLAVGLQVLDIYPMQG